MASKEPRRQKISERYRIVLLCGDNLSDFSNLFEGKIPDLNAPPPPRSPREFGAQFIVPSERDVW